MANLDEKKIAFLKGLTELTRKTGICIGGCGCCGSPYLIEATITSDKSGYACLGRDGEGEEVTWLDFSDYYWEKNSKYINKL